MTKTRRGDTYHRHDVWVRAVGLGIDRFHSPHAVANQHDLLKATANEFIHPGSQVVDAVGDGLESRSA